ncbi:MAG: hypothetical protein K8823_1464 [Cenarchaeum symbiont of Oopsacas minuta]|nr:hypothetical protein [Cenarchaeum symbiont of Oopsacas minuta]
MNDIGYKYEVDVIKTDNTQKITPEVKESLKSAGMVDDKGKLKIKGVSAKMLKRMKQEYVKCPVLKDEIQFVQCFVCPNFQSRVMGSILCKGNKL